MRTRPRRNHWPQVRVPGHWFGMGPSVPDALTGVQYPRQLMVPQRGGLVSNRPADGHVDYIEGRDWPVEAQPEFPVPLYRMTFPFLGAFQSLVTQDRAERDALVNAGWTWTPGGFGYQDAAAEAGLVPVYRLFNVIAGDHLLTANVAEEVAVLGAGYVLEGIAFYAFTTGGGFHNRTPLFRLNASGLHYYTTDPFELAALPGSFTREGISCYVMSGAERSLN